MYDLERRFNKAQPLNQAVAQSSTLLRQLCFNLAKMVGELPESREREQCLTKIEEALHWGDSAILHNQVAFPAVVRDVLAKAKEPAALPADPAAPPQDPPAPGAPTNGAQQRKGPRASRAKA